VTFPWTSPPSAHQPVPWVPALPVGTVMLISGAAGGDTNQWDMQSHEKLLFTVLVVISLLLISHIIASFCDVLSNLDPEHAAFRTRMVSWRACDGDPSAAAHPEAHTRPTRPRRCVLHLLHATRAPRTSHSNRTAPPSFTRRTTSTDTAVYTSWARRCAASCVSTSTAPRRSRWATRNAS
jgi:hypothetical protein